MVLYSEDSVKVINDYYLELIDLNSWEIGPSGIETGSGKAFITIYQEDFHADINIEKDSSDENKTKIEVNVTCQKDQEIISTFNTPTNPKNPPESSNPETTQNNYVLPFSNSRLVTKNDLNGLTPWELKVARNEIYARHGRSFVHKDLSCYFQKQNWYKIDTGYTEKKLSRIETSNAVFILNFEKEINSPLLNKDGGCK